MVINREMMNKAVGAVGKRKNEVQRCDLAAEYFSRFMCQLVEQTRPARTAPLE